MVTGWGQVESVVAFPGEAGAWSKGEAALSCPLSEIAGRITKESDENGS